MAEYQNQMAPDEREAWIIEWLKQRPGAAVDVIDAEFVTAYIEKSGADAKFCFPGAPKCRQLGLDLSKLFKEKKLTRYAIGLPSGDASMGFPKWVYCYELKQD